MAGKFFVDLPDPDTLPKIKEKKPPVVKKGREQLAGKRGCNVCPLKECWGTISTRKMDTIGSPRGDILVLGASPSEDDDSEGKPFENEAGQLVKGLIPPRARKRVVYQNLVRCHDPAHGEDINVAPPTQAAYACSKYLGFDLEDCNIKAIVGIGQGPLSYFWPGAQIWRVYGTRFPVTVSGKTYWYYPVIDPNTIINNKKFKLSKYKKPEWDSAWPVIKADIAAFFDTVDDWPAPVIRPFDKASVRLCYTEEEAREAMAGLKHPYGVDIETNGLKPMVYGARILSASFADESRAVAWPINHREASNDWGFRLMVEFLQKARWIAHNAAFEWTWINFFYNGNTPLPTWYEDSQAAARVLHSRETILSLADLTRVHLGVDVKEYNSLDVTRLDDYPIKDVLEYNGLDAIACVRLFNKIWPFRIKGNPTYERILGSIFSTSAMELAGLPVDLEAEQELRLKWEAKKDAAEVKIRGLYEVKAFRRIEGKDLDIASTQQIARVLTQFGKIRLPKTEKGNFKTDMASLLEAAPDHPLVNTLGLYREAAKQISTYLDPIAAVPVLYPDNRLHPSYTTMLTSTLRLSSTDPNIQNYPKRRHREIRRVIRVPGGYIIVSIDFGQIEVRVLAMASNDANLCAAIIGGEDMHAKWLNKLLGAYPDYLNILAEETNEKDEAKIRKGGRDIVKTHFVFASFYGSDAKGCSTRSGIPLEYMQALSEEFWAEYRGVAAWHKEQRNHYQRYGSVRMLDGLLYHGVLPGNEVINYPIQNGDALLVGEARNALARMSVAENDPYLLPRIDVHDDLSFIFPDRRKQLETYMMRVMKEMVKVRFDWQIVPLMVEAKIGTNWSELEEVVNYVGKYNR